MEVEVAVKYSEKCPVLALGFLPFREFTRI
jgi:hypothetical protein